MLRRPRAIVAVVLLLLAAPFAALGKDVPPPVQQQPLSGVPQGFEVLGQRAAFHTDFTFDRSMLQMASYFIGDNDPDARAAIAKLNGISVHSYHFAAPGLYDPAQLDLIRRQYESAGWRHLVAAHNKNDPYSTGQTDLWINLAHMDVTGMMVLVSGAKDLNLIALNGDISTVDLLHLRGHFGIPRFSGDRFVTGPTGPTGPAPRGRQPYVSPGPAAPMPEQAPDPGPDQYPGSVGIGSPTGEAAPPPPTPPGF